MMLCQYRICRGIMGHRGPHLFDVSDIERIVATTVIAERKRIAAVVGELPVIPVADMSWGKSGVMHIDTATSRDALVRDDVIDAILAEP